MEFYRLWRILLGYKVPIIILTLTATVVAVALTYALPAVYEASSLVIVRPEEKIKLSPNRGEGKEILDFPVSQAAPIDAPSKTYMEVIQSEAVAQRIVRALNLDAEDTISNASTFERWRDEFKRWLKETIRNTRHILRYGRVIPATRFERAVEDLRESLTLEVKKNTYAFGITYSSGNPTEAAAVANKAAEIFLAHNAEAYRSEAETLRKFLESRLLESEKKMQDARDALQRFKDQAGIFSMGDEYREQLKVTTGLELDLESAQRRLAGLLEVFGPENGKVASVKAEISRLHHALEAHQASFAGMPDSERKVAQFELGVRIAQDDYAFIKTKYEEYRIEEQTSFDEIRVVSPATVPLYPTKPLKYIYAGLGFLLSLVTAIALALFFEYLKPRVRVVSDLTATLDIPVLAAIPVMKPARRRWR